jgi:hypothetical protein
MAGQRWNDVMLEMVRKENLFLALTERKARRGMGDLMLWI